MNLSPEVLVYLQSIKKYFQQNEEVKKYFLIGSDEEFFFKSLCNIAEINFKKYGEPHLTDVQFELLRLSSKIVKKVNKNNYDSNLIFEYIPNNIKFYVK